MNTPRYVIDGNLHRLRPQDDGRSLPFPVDAIPEILRSRMYFVERFSEKDFLRSISNPFFLLEVNAPVIQIEIPTERMDSTTGDLELEAKDLVLNWVQFNSGPMCVGFEFEGEVRWFVPVVESGTSIDKLEPEMQAFYDAADLHRLDEARRSMLITRALEVGGAG